MTLRYRIERIFEKHLERRERAALHEIHRISPEKLDSLDIGYLREASTIKSYGAHIGRLIDIGAHAGSFTTAMCKLWPLSELICVEPDKASLATLKRSVPKHAKIVEAAIGGTPGRRNFFVHPDSSMNSLISVGEDFDRQWAFYRSNEITQHEVEVQTLDSLVDLLDDRKTKDILLKVDVQGAEFEVLSSGSSLLELASICVVEHMFWTGYKTTYDLADLLTLMKDRGFRCVGACRTEFRKSGQVAYSDLIFLPDNIRGNGSIHFHPEG